MSNRTAKIDKLRFANHVSRKGYGLGYSVITNLPSKIVFVIHETPAKEAK